MILLSVACGEKVDKSNDDIKTEENELSNNTYEENNEADDNEVDNNEDTEDEISDDDYVAILSYVDQKLSETIKNEVYQKASFDEKVQMITEVLEILIEENYIVSYTVHKESNNPYAIYNYVGGGEGSVLFKEFNKYQN